MSVSHLFVGCDMEMEPLLEVEGSPLLKLVFRGVHSSMSIGNLEPQSGLFTLCGCTILHGLLGLTQ